MWLITVIGIIDEKSALAAGAGQFNRSASMAYSALSAMEEEDLEKLCVKKDQALSRREIKKAGKKIFEKIEKQVNTVTIL